MSAWKETTLQSPVFRYVMGNIYWRIVYNNVAVFRSLQFLLFLLNGATNYLTRARLVAMRVLTNQLGLRYKCPKLYKLC